MAEEQYNLDELVAPGFMDEAYIVKILRQVEDDPDLHVGCSIMSSKCMQLR